MRTRLLPLLSDWEWQDRAACRGMNSAVFFPPQGERGHRRCQREEQARRICERCEVIEACTTMALHNQEPYGVWGGMTAGERQGLFTLDRRNADQGAG